MTDNRKEISENLQRAQTSINAAKDMLEKKYYDIAASRAYYAAFYAASALLLKEDIDTTKHSGVIASIHRLFVKEGKLDQAQGRNLQWLFDLRGVGDSGNGTVIISLIYYGPLTVTNFSPASGTSGTSVTITGTNFNGVTAVSFGGTAASSYTVNSLTEISAVVGSGASGSVSVTTATGTGSLAGFTYNPAPANPTGASASVSPICSGFSTQLTATGAVGTVYWYTGSCGGTQVGTGNPLTVSPTSTTTYYARNYNNSQFSAGCASVTVTVSSPSFVPTARTVADLQATGTGIKWYAASTGGSPLLATTALVNGTHYYASQTVGGVESLNRLDVVANLDLTPCKPTGSASQSFSAGATVASLAATGSNIRWYSASSGGTALSTSTVLVNGTHYYATQTVDCTESLRRLDVTVTIN